LLVAAAGFYVIFLAGLSWKLIAGGSAAVLASLPVLWGVLHDYQRRRFLTLLDPSSDPLGAGITSSSRPLPWLRRHHRQGLTNDPDATSSSSRNAPRISFSRCIPRNSG